MAHVGSLPLPSQCGFPEIGAESAAGPHRSRVQFRLGGGALAFFACCPGPAAFLWSPLYVGNTLAAPNGQPAAWLRAAQHVGFCGKPRSLPAAADGQKDNFDRSEMPASAAPSRFDLVGDFCSDGTHIFSFGGGAMRHGFGKLIASLTVLLAVAGTPASSEAADLGLMTSGRGGCSEIVFVCENGRQYPLCPIAVSVVGEVVTASLHMSPGTAAHVRLVPMGVGYRYAGRGIWLDGFRQNALLNFGKHTRVACTIQQS
jgi:hypothetical protein